MNGLHGGSSRKDSRSDCRSDSSVPLPSPSGPLRPEIDDHVWSPRRRQHNSPQRPLYDNRLQYVKASSWTSVVVEDRLFSRILSSFFTWDHPLWRLFDEDLFFSELVAGRSNLCSKLLVNAILAYGCVSLLVTNIILSSSADTSLAKLLRNRASHRGAWPVLFRRSKAVVAS